MACSKYEYVRKYESPSFLLPRTYIVVRIDGRGFTKFTTSYNFEKPNDKKGISLMNKAAEETMKNFPDIFLAYGQSDEYSFIFNKCTTLFSRRSEKIISCVTSCFSSAYSIHFNDFFPDKKLTDIPMFDGRCILYPDLKTLRDYLSWRQVDCHINNLYNTAFWCLVKSGVFNQEAEKILKVMKSDEKNELLFTKFGVNYNNEPEIFRKGTILIWMEDFKEKHKDKNIEENKLENVNKTRNVIKLHEDLIQDFFWEKYKNSLDI